MKRRRETEKGCEMRSAIEEITMMLKLMKKVPLVMDEGGVDDDDDDRSDACAIVPTRPFLSICYLVLHVLDIQLYTRRGVLKCVNKYHLDTCTYQLELLDKIGPTMAVLRQDIDKNIRKIEMVHEVDPSMYSNLVEMLKKEKREGIAKKGNSCCKAFVWLTRSLDFTAALLQRVLMDGGQNNMEQMVEEAYNITLKPWHGWISSAAFKIALKLVPDKKTFIELLTVKGENSDTLEEEMQTFIALLVSCLQDIHSILRFYGLEKLKST